LTYRGQAGKKPPSRTLNYLSRRNSLKWFPRAFVVLALGDVRLSN